MTLLVFGKTGQVAQELSKFDDVICLGRDVADLTDPAACATAIRERKPSAVINAAAYTAVDKAETEEALAETVNASAPGAMAQACAELGIPFVHISTDYVFEGNGDIPWQPSDSVAPQNAYGRSKLKGEETVADAGGTHAILRTSWVVSPHGNNFVKTMLRLGAERDGLSIVADQIGAPTSARSIAQSCVTVAKALCDTPEKSGVYHLQNTPFVSWAGFATEIFAQSGISCNVTEIPSSEFPTPAVRPLNSRLDCSSLEATFGIAQSDWRAELSDILVDLGVKQ